MSYVYTSVIIGIIIYSGLINRRSCPYLYQGTTMHFGNLIKVTTCPLRCFGNIEEFCLFMHVWSLQGEIPLELLFLFYSGNAEMCIPINIHGNMMYADHIHIFFFSLVCVRSFAYYIVHYFDTFFVILP